MTVATPVGGGILKGVTGFVGIAAMDYGIGLATGSNVTLLGSIGFSALWQLLGKGAAPATVFMVGPEVLALARDISRNQGAAAYHLRTPHRAGRGLWVSEQSFNLQEQGLRNIMNYRRAIGMGMGHEASLLHR